MHSRVPMAVVRHGEGTMGNQMWNQHRVLMAKLRWKLLSCLWSSSCWGRDETRPEIGHLPHLCSSHLCLEHCVCWGSCIPAAGGWVPLTLIFILILCRCGLLISILLPCNWILWGERWIRASKVWGWRQHCQCWTVQKVRIWWKDSLLHKSPLTNDLKTVLFVVLCTKEGSSARHGPLRDFKTTLQNPCSPPAIKYGFPCI